MHEILKIQIGDVESAARSLAAVRGRGTMIEWPAGGVGNEAHAYKIQQKLHSAFARAGLQRGGWKIAVSAPGQYTPLGLVRPGVGGVLKRDIHASGAALRMDRFVKVGIETEVAYLVGTAAPHTVYPLDVYSARKLVEAVMPAFEVIENRYQNLPALDGPTRIADDFLQAACVLGAEVREWQALGLAEQAGTLRHNGHELTDCKADSSFDSLHAFTFVANLLEEIGTPLQAGEIVLTGSLHKPMFLEHPGLYEAVLPGLGSVQLRLI